MLSNGSESGSVCVSGRSSVSTADSVGVGTAGAACVDGVGGGDGKCEIVSEGGKRGGLRDWLKVD